MLEYIQYFCAGPQTPTDESVRRFFEQDSSDYRLDSDGVLTKDGFTYLQVEINHPSDNIFGEEIEEFRDRVLKEENTSPRLVEHVLSALNETTAIVAIRLSFGALVLAAQPVDLLTAYLGETCPGLAFSEEKGFFRGHETILKLTEIDVEKEGPAVRFWHLMEQGAKKMLADRGDFSDEENDDGLEESTPSDKGPRERAWRCMSEAAKSIGPSAEDSMYLRQCINSDGPSSELFILSPRWMYDFAGVDRDRYSQAILGIDESFGCGSDDWDMLENEACLNIIGALGVGLDLGDGSSFDLDKLRYGRVIVATDDSQESAQVCQEFSRLLWTHMRPLLEAKVVYLVRPPIKAGITAEEFGRRVLDGAVRQLKPIIAESTLEATLARLT